MTILLTGAAGFIGYHTVRILVAEGHRVVGLDSLNDYYDVALKKARLAELQNCAGFTFHRVNIADRAAMEPLAAQYPEVTHIIHLAAQAGVRYSLENPHAYVESNLAGHLVMLEWARHAPQLQHFIYASSSSVYGGNTKLPFAIDDPVNTPVSLYAATKRADELMTHTYTHLYGIPATGLRFFTVYGPWGRPDMAYFSFTRRIIAGEPITVFNHGDMRRNFTYIDDVRSAILACLAHTPDGHRLYNIGNNTSEPLMRFVSVLEDAIGKKAIIEFAGMQPGDVKDTVADITATARDLDFHPATDIAEGLPQFVAWYRGYYGE